MKKLSFATLFCILFLAFISAGPRVSADTFHLKLSELKPIGDAIASLDKGVEIQVPQSQGDPRVITQPFDFSADVRWEIYRDEKALNDALLGLEQTRVDTIRRVSGGKDEIKAEEKEKIAKFNAEMAPVLEKPMTVELTKFKKDDLNLAKNAIPITTLMALSPIISADK